MTCIKDESTIEAIKQAIFDWKPNKVQRELIRQAQERRIFLTKAPMRFTEIAVLRYLHEMINAKYQR